MSEICIKINLQTAGRTHFPTNGTKTCLKQRQNGNSEMYPLGEWSDQSIFLPRLLLASSARLCLFVLLPKPAACSRAGENWKLSPSIFTWCLFLCFFFILSKWNERWRDWYPDRPGYLHSNRQSSTGTAAGGMATSLLTSCFHGIANCQADVCLLNRWGLSRACHMSHDHSSCLSYTSTSQ